MADFDLRVFIIAHSAVDGKKADGLGKAGRSAPATFTSLALACS